MSTLGQQSLTRPYSADDLIKKKTFTSSQGTQHPASHRNNSDIEYILMSRRQSQGIDRPKNQKPYMNLNLSRASTPNLTTRDRPGTAPSHILAGIYNHETQNTNNDSRIDLKPAKKINTDNLHKTAYSLKAKSEEIEDKIKRLENWQDSMKRNEIWNTPSAHIIKAVLEFSSQSNPNGYVSQYLNEEKMKKNQGRTSRKIRYSKTPNPAKMRKTVSVENFFKDDEIEVNEEITSIIKAGPARKAFNREEVAQKLNSYLTVMKSFQSNMDAKDMLTPTQRKLLDPNSPVGSSLLDASNTDGLKQVQQNPESTLQTERHPGTWENNSEMLSQALKPKKKEFLSASIPLRMSSEGMYRRSAGLNGTRMPVHLSKNNIAALERSSSEIKFRGTNDQSTSTIRPYTRGTVFANSQLPNAQFIQRPIVERDLNARKFFDAKRASSRHNSDVRTLSIDSRYLRSVKPGMMANSHSMAPGKSVLKSWVSIHNQTDHSNMMYEASNEIKA